LLGQGTERTDGQNGDYMHTNVGRKCVVIKHGITVNVKNNNRIIVINVSALIYTILLFIEC